MHALDIPGTTQFPIMLITWVISVKNMVILAQVIPYFSNFNSHSYNFTIHLRLCKPPI